MRSLHTRIRTTIVAATLSVMALASFACSDTRTPYQAYLDCDADIANAKSIKGFTSCLTDNHQALLRARSKGDDAWLTRFQGSRPIVKRLHEEQLQGVADESILMVVGQTKSGQPVAISVQMRRDRGRWKIDYEEFIAKGATHDDARPVSVGLKAVGGEPWYPGELAGSIHRRPDGDCRLSIAHVFDYPMIRITAGCQLLGTAGTYSLQDLTAAAAEVTGSTPVTFYDAQHTWLDRVEGGQLTVDKTTGGVVSGQFTFDVANASDRLSVVGSFSNLPLDP